MDAKRTEQRQSTEVQGGLKYFQLFGPGAPLFKHLEPSWQSKLINVQLKLNETVNYHQCQQTKSWQYVQNVWESECHISAWRTTSQGMMPSVTFTHRASWGKSGPQESAVFWCAHLVWECARPDCGGWCHWQPHTCKLRSHSAGGDAGRARCCS